MSSDATALLPSEQLPQKKKIAARTVLVAGSLVLLALGLLWLSWLFFLGRVSGCEFDALSWTRRSFHFLRDPLTGRQLTGIGYADQKTVDPSIGQYILGGGLAPTTPRWDLVWLAGASAYSVGRAQILLDYLDAEDTQGQPYWRTWTTQHPQAAPILWSAVRDCVHLLRYDGLPELFESARTQTDPNLLHTALAAAMVSLALDEARSQQLAGASAAAARAARLGLQYDPDSPTLREILSSSQ